MERRTWQRDKKKGGQVTVRLSGACYVVGVSKGVRVITLTPHTPNALSSYC
jgi:hypothetical protein